MGNLIYQTQSNLVSHAYCGTYSLFCVFSDSRASSLEEAQSNCKKINDKSWPVELDDWNFGDTFKIFIQNYSISNIILNAQNKNGTWFWIQAKIDISERTLANMDVGEFLVYDKQPSVEVYSVVCMIECKASWIDYENVGSKLKSFLVHRTTTGIEGCKYLCDKYDSCTYVDVVQVSSGSHLADCALHDKDDDPGHLEPKKGSHHVIDRSTKTVEKCIGSEKQTDYTYLIMLIGLLTLLMLLWCLVLYLKCCGNTPKSYSTESSAIPSN